MRIRSSFTKIVAAIGLAALSVPLNAGTAHAAGPMPAGVVVPAAAPVPPPPTVTADALPTWQINGVVWSQAVVGDTVYVAGSFTRARPPGVAAGGAGEVVANNAFAYSLSTGNRVASFAPSLNAQAMVVRASPDGSRVYYGGDFTSVNGIARGHVAAFSTATNALVTTWAPNVNGQVRGFGITASTVFVGGNFLSAAGQPRTRLAAFSPANGAITSWAPAAAGGFVWTMTMSPDRTRVIPGGSFTTINGQPAYGMGSINVSDGSLNPWPAQEKIRVAGANGAITSLKSDATQVYGTSYAFGAGASFEGTFAIDPTSGQINWANDCLGDTYDIAAAGDVLYNVSHQHDCTVVGGWPDTNPRVRWQKAGAQMSYATDVTTQNDVYGWNFIGVPYAALLHWYPNFAFGSYTPAGQAGWAIDTAGDYVVVGGEFPRVNGVNQQGLVRFRTKAGAPNKSGPAYSTVPATPVPSTNAVSLAAGSVRVTWGSAWDMDDETLTYEVLRNNNTWVHTQTAKSNFWTLPRLGFVDTGLSPGSTQRYQVRITDSSGNVLWSPVSNTVTVGTGAPSAYAAAVASDGAEHHWRLGEPSGPSVLDWSGFDDSTLSGTFTRSATGALLGDPDASTTFDGSTAFAVNSAPVVGPQLFTVETWFRTTTTSGGKIVGFGNNNTGLSSNYDRHIYMAPDGRLVFGVYNNGGYTVNTSTALNDGQWHHAVGTLDANGVTLYVDGKRIGRNGGTTTAQPYSGYWRIGGDSPWEGNAYFAGDIDEVAVYSSALSLDQVRDHFTDSGRTATWPVRPADAYGQAVWDANPDVYFRLDESAGTTAKDSSPNGVDGVYTASGVTYGVVTPVTGSTSAVTFDGQFATGVATGADMTAPPGAFTHELWFKTTTTQGGKLIGKGCAQTGNSWCYDRHVWMENSGQLSFGVWTGTTNITTSPASYNDGQWHYLVASQGPDGLKLYVDSILVGTNPQTQAEASAGYWRIGGDSRWSGNSDWFAGTIDEVAVYSTVLSPATVVSHFTTGGGVVPNVPPTASFSVTQSALTVTVDGSSSTDPDGSIASYAWDFGDGATAAGVDATHTYAVAGAYSVALTVTDNGGASSASTQVVSAVIPPADAYGAAVYASGPDLYWRLGESAGPVAADVTARMPGNYFGSGLTLGQSGAVPGSDTSVTFDGTGAGVSSSGSVTNPTVYSEELWFKTTTTAGGKLLGFGNQPVGGSSSYDRHVYMLPSGELQFGVRTGFTNIIGTSTPYNDGAWHHVIATQGADGMRLYVDGELAASGTQTQAENYTGYWRVGGDSGWGGATWFAGQIDEVAIYSRVLTPADAMAHFLAGGGVIPSDPPVASFTTSVTGRVLSVDGSASSDPDGTVVSHTWDFGDGSSASGVTASHTYGAPGTFLVTLTVVDNSGTTGSASQSVTIVNAPPAAAFTQSANYLALSVDGSTSADADGTIADYAWDFGDGATGTGPTATHTYAAGGTFTVALTVTDNDGATNTTSQSVTVAPNQAPSAAFTHSETHLALSVDGSTSTDADGTIAGYAWDFGDGATGTGPTATHTYAAGGTFTVALTVTDNAGATATTSQAVTVTAPANLPPTAAFTTAVTGRSVAVDGTGSSDPDGSIASYAWDFGDGGTATGSTAGHPYAAAGGTFTVTLTVTDNEGATGTITHQVTIPANMAPAAAITHSESTLTTSVSGTGSSDADGTVVSYVWDFGDGTTATGATASRTYAAPGTYTVTLTVTDNEGATGSSSVAVTVVAVNPFATDDFGRTLASGWGTADLGGAWTTSGAASQWSVSGGTGQVRLNAGAGGRASLPSVSSATTETALTVTTDRAPTGGGQYVTVMGRRVSDTTYFGGKLRLGSNGAVTAYLTRVVAGIETTLSTTPIAGLAYVAGDKLDVRMQVFGTNPTTVRMKVWKSGTSEPVGWATTTTDATAALQAAGSVGVYCYASGSTTNPPVVFGIDAVWAGPLRP